MPLLPGENCNVSNDNGVFTSFDSLPWLSGRTIFLTKAGSHAYGMATPESDLDVRGVAIAPKRYYLGFTNRFDQAESKGDPDVVIYDFKKFCGLAAQCNPNIIELLWTDESDWLRSSELWVLLQNHRKDFLSRRAKHTFSGYAASQLKRINTHRRWLLNPPQHCPERAEFGLPERTVIPKDQLAVAQALVRKKVDSWELDLEHLSDAQRIYVLGQIENSLTDLYGANITEGKTLAAAKLLGMDENLIDLLYRERNYTNAKQEWDSYQTWKRNRNPARAALEAQFGVDTKHASHLIRLLRMCREILERGEVLVKRPDAEDLLAIRNGAWTYERIVEWATQEDQALTAVMNVSKLPRSPDTALLDTLCTRIIEEGIATDGSLVEG